MATGSCWCVRTSMSPGAATRSRPTCSALSISCGAPRGRQWQNRRERRSTFFDEAACRAFVSARAAPPLIEAMLGHACPLSARGRRRQTFRRSRLTEPLQTQPAGDGPAAYAPNVWTGCYSQVRVCGRKSLICIRPIDRHAGRGLDGNTHAPLISLADRPTSSRLGHQIQGASINPFHAIPQSRTRSRGQLDRRDLKVGVEGFVVAQDTPDDARELVGQGHSELVPVQPL
jgi:hypothetical protein